MSATRAARALLRRDLSIALHAGGGAGAALVFFLTLCVVMPFAIGPRLALLSALAPAVLWIGALLASLLTLERIFAADAEDGSLDLIRSGPLPLEGVVAVKALAHWLTTGLPLTLAAPLFGLLLAIEPAAAARTTLTLLIGTPALSMLGAIGAALTTGLRRGGLLTAILTLPLATPVLIFGVGAAGAEGRLGEDGAIERAPLYLLIAVTLAVCALAPFGGAAALRAND